MNKKKTLRLTQLAIFIALELVIAYTPLGYMSVPGLTISFMMVPVTLGAILLGPLEGAILGSVFGLTSFVQCFGASAFGAALLNINPVMTFIVCVLPRVLAGWLPGLIFHMIYRENLRAAIKNVTFGVSALLGSVFNTVFFMTGIVVCFYNTGYIQSMASVLGATNPLIFVILFVGVQGVIEGAVCFVISGILSRSLYKIVRANR